MWFLSALLCLSNVVHQTNSDLLPTLYEYYAPKNTPIKSGLTIVGDRFRLNDKPFLIFSGSFHYFRVVPEQWRPTLRKFKAAGLNSVQFYIPWNLHEPQPGHFDFESYGLNLTQFLVDIYEADMFAIVRPGPYICAEVDFGGLPAWLLKDPNMNIRSEYPGFMEPSKRYFSRVLDIFDRFQFSKYGGPIIAMQYENEYYSDPDIDHRLSYLDEFQKLITFKNFTQFLFSSENLFGEMQFYEKPDMFEALNFNDGALEKLLYYRTHHLPIYVAEFWTGWHDRWGAAEHRTYPLWKFKKEMSTILFNMNGSINIFMFRGGTNFGFSNGDRSITSYDFDAPLSESGNYTDKYWQTKEFYAKLIDTGRHPKILIPSEPPPIDLARNYGTVQVNFYLSLDNLLKLMNPIQSERPLFMEFIDGSPGYGFILYRFQSKPFKTLNITGSIRDRMVVTINGKTVNRTADSVQSYYQTMDASWFSDPEAVYTIDILVENQGRVDYSTNIMNQERKGINSPILLDEKEQQQFQIFTFDLNATFMQQVNLFDQWKTLNSNINNTGPLLLRTYLVIEDETPSDTFLLLPEWTHGNVFVNNFNIGRYNRAGPQKTLYIPGPLLKRGINTIHVFETGTLGSELRFIDHPILQ